jgi:hypothetical protein
MKKLIVVFALIALPAAAQAQAPSQAATAKAEMKKLNFLAGQWQGEGWIDVGQGQRRTFRQSETVQSKLDGLLFVIDGLGKGKLPGSDEEVVVHNAFAVLSYDEAAKRFRWHAYRADGLFVDADTVVGDNQMVWSFANPRGGKIRFTIKLTDKGRWHEVGEFSPDGSAWRQFFEMTLEKM